MKAVLLWVFWSVFAFADSNGFPDVLLIGAQKAGTTALMKILSQHPNIVTQSSVPPIPVHFFNGNYEKGNDWYKAQFPQSVAPNVLRLEKSPDYLFYSNVPERAFLTVPKAKIIVLLRNPVDRAYSQYRMHERWRFSSFSFEHEIAKEKQYLEASLGSISEQWDVFAAPDIGKYTHLARGLYAIQLERWFAYYPRDQIFIIETEDLAKNTKKVIEDTLTFLDLPQYDAFDFSVGKVNRYPPMSLETRRELSRFFQPFNQSLESLLGRKFDWNGDY